MMKWLNSRKLLGKQNWTTKLFPCTATVLLYTRPPNSCKKRSRWGVASCQEKCYLSGGQKLVLKKTGNEMWKQSSQKWRQRFEDKKENFAYMCSQQRDWRSKVVTIRSKFFNCWSRWFNFARVTVSVGSRGFPRMFIRQNWNKEVQKPLPSRILPRNTFTPSRINTKKLWQWQYY